MKEEQTLYKAIALKLKGAIESQMFGHPCLKFNGKAFACLYNNDMVFKLNGNIHKEAIGLKGALLFDPSGKKRPMKEWVQLSFDHKDKWAKYAKEARDYANTP
jgi:hypothetical protein